MQFNTKIGAVLVAFLFGLMVIAGLGQGALAQAQVTSSMALQSQPNVCFTPAYNLRYGAADWNTGGSVSQLQSYLASEGYFSNAYLGSGRFGAITLRAVAQFQAAHGLPATGYFGPMTRALVQQLGCGTVVVPPTQSVSVYSVSPVVTVGSTMSVTGFGFTSNNTVLIDGMLAMRGVPVASSIAIACTTNPTCHGGINQTLSFTLPSSLSPNCPVGSMCPLYMKVLTPGVHTLSIQNENGISNAVSFTVSGVTTNQPLSISGLSAPASLSLGQQGTWTVTVLSNGAGNLHYSVTWGDEATYGSAIMAPQTTSVQSSSTFTHTYSRSGTYTPVFTVTDDFGHSISASNTIVVTPLY